MAEYRMVRRISEWSPMGKRDEEDAQGIPGEMKT
jgi:hypothetical protein